MLKFLRRGKLRGSLTGKRNLKIAIDGEIASSRILLRSRPNENERRSCLLTIAPLPLLIADPQVGQFRSFEYQKLKFLWKLRPPFSRPAGRSWMEFSRARNEWVSGSVWPVGGSLSAPRFAGWSCRARERVPECLIIEHRALFPPPPRSGGAAIIRSKKQKEASKRERRGATTRMHACLCVCVSVSAQTYIRFTRFVWRRRLDTAYFLDGDDPAPPRGKTRHER